jgi:hypothetical protein
VCVQPLLVWRAREGEDLTFDKSDPKDAVIIARLATWRPNRRVKLQRCKLMPLMVCVAEVPQREVLRTPTVADARYDDGRTGLCHMYDASTTLASRSQISTS